MRLDAKKIRILELATDVCDEVRHNVSSDIVQSQADDLIALLQSFRHNFGRSEPLSEEP